jgi:hypothetical protein
MLGEEWAGEWVRREAARWLVRAREEFRKEMRLQTGSQCPQDPMAHEDSI